MSDRHREALTHLNYGLGGAGSGDNGGFVLLTGEVGTGKTTVSRCLMADLPENTQLAFILNPTLSSQELLATICDQLKIRYRKTGATLKTLTDKISEKLLKNHANDINTLLIVDEAQHLEAEVLEQLRLLTNLETNTKKLLQVILIGQPELQQLLKRRDLRQLAQRITARYHLLPLNQQELVSYIKHRLSVADCHRALFNKSAIAAIHKLSQGIPRLINLICHSALMTAYNSNNAVVDKKIVYQAASQALGDDFKLPVWWQQKSTQFGVAAGVLMILLSTGFWIGQGQFNEESSLQVENDKQIKALQKQIQALNDGRIVKPEVTTEQGAASKVSILTTKQQVVEQKGIEQLVVNGEKNNQPAQDSEVVTSSIRSVETVHDERPSELLPEQDYQIEAIDGVSEDLLARFQAAVDDTKTENSKPLMDEQAQMEQGEVQSLTQMPAWVQKGIPSLRFEQHIYASDGAGWVNVNGRDRYEGDVVAEGLSIEQILPQQVILTYRGEKFSLPALTNW